MQQKRTEAPTTSTILVALALRRLKEASGYEVEKGLQQTAQAAAYHPLNKAGVYVELQRLGRLGYATGTYVPQRGRPSKHTYRLTEAGQAWVTQWVQEAPPTRDLTKSLDVTRLLNGQMTTRDLPLMRTLLEARAARQYDEVVGLTREVVTQERDQTPPTVRRGIDLGRMITLALLRDEAEGRLRATEAALETLHGVEQEMAQATTPRRRKVVAQ